MISRNFLKNVHFNILPDIGENPLLIVSNGRIKSAVFQRLFSSISEKNIIIVSGEPNLNDIGTVYKKLSINNNFKFSSVVSFGGGSVIDFAKILVVSLDNEVRPEELLNKNVVDLKRATPFFVIPTTYGSGSEATSIAVYIRNGIKSSIKSDVLIPDAVSIFESAYTDIPEKLSKYFIADAFCHAIESFYSKKSNELSRAVSREALAMIARGILADNNSASIFATASYLAGISEDYAGVGAIHALAYPLQNILHIPHAEANAIILSKFREGKLFLDDDFNQLAGLQIGKIINFLKDDRMLVKKNKIESMVSQCFLYKHLLQNSPLEITEKFIRNFYQNLHE